MIYLYLLKGEAKIAPINKRDYYNVTIVPHG